MLKAYTTILRPFQLVTWVVVLFFFIVFALIRIVIAAYFAEPRTLNTIWKQALGEQDAIQINETHNQERVRLVNKTAVFVHGFAVSAFIVIVILFYEIAVVNFIFQKQKPMLQKELSNLDISELKDYVIIEKDGTDKIFRSHVDPKGTYKNRIPPWHICKDGVECLRNENPLMDFSAGWYYGSGVPVETQLEMDKAILHMRMHDRIRELINRAIDLDNKADCASNSSDIAPGIVAWLLLSIAIICVIPLIIFLLYASRIRQTMAKSIEAS
eukprot:IDg2186t1